MQAKPIRNADFDRSTAKHVTFYNEKFKRGRCDLLKEIQRSTRGGGSANNLAEHQKEVEALKSQVADLELQVKTTKKQMEERMTKLELDMLGQMEQMMLAMQQNQQAQLLQRGISVASVASGNMPPTPAAGMNTTTSTEGAAGWDPLPMAGLQNRRTSAGSNFSANAAMVSSESIGQQPPPPQAQQQQVNAPVPAPAAAAAAPTLPPHPKQKQLPPVQGGFPMGNQGPPSRLNSLRGISFNRGISRGLSVESTASAQLMRNSWEDKFFSVLMLGESEASAVAAANSAAEAASASAAGNGGTTAAAATTMPASGPMSDTMVEAALAEAAAEAGVGITSTDDSGKRGSLSSVSTSDMP